MPYKYTNTITAFEATERSETMEKITTLFERNWGTDYQVRDEFVPGTEWVAAGEGIATRKLDGTACMVRKGRLYRRYEVKEGRTPPDVFIAAGDPDPETGKQPGWLPATDKPDDRWLIEAWDRAEGDLPDGTYELVGPKIQGNKEGYTAHVLVSHNSPILHLGEDVPRDFEGLRLYLASSGIEGVVWHHEDGRMVKIKARDFGIKR